MSKIVKVVGESRTVKRRAANSDADIITNRVTRCRVPSDLVVTPGVIVSLAKRMPTPALEDIIEHLIWEVDSRAGDPDLEQEQDACDDNIMVAVGSNQSRERRQYSETIVLPVIKQRGHQQRVVS